jgi:ParB family chromosome partitioning protein
MWDLHPRIEPYITEESCRAEIDSFLRHGQLIPALGRTVSGDQAHDIELVCGARRLFVARHLNKPLMVEIRSMTDQEAIIAMEIENQHRREVSPYERGLSYAHWLRAATFASQEELARALRVSPSQVSRLLKVSRLPSVIVGAFAKPADICEGWGLALFESWEDPTKREATARKARAIAALEQRPSARDVYQQLMSAPNNQGRSRASKRDEIVRASDGRALFRVKRRASSIAMVLPNGAVSEHCLQEIKRSLSEILQRSSPRPALPARARSISLS